MIYQQFRRFKILINLFNTLDIRAFSANLESAEHNS